MTCSKEDRPAEWRNPGERKGWGKRVENGLAACRFQRHELSVLLADVLLLQSSTMTNEESNRGRRYKLP
jgi:hypothetical protein